MNQAQHTPGPWQAKHRAGNDGMFRTEIFSSEFGGIATCNWTPKNCGNGVTGTYREANASLIAAAPDLLEIAISNAEYRAARDSEFGRGYNAAKNGQRRDTQKESADWYAGFDARTAIAKATGGQS